LLQDDIPPALGARLGNIDLVAGIVEKVRDYDVALELGLTNLSLDAATVDSNITEI